MLRIPTARLAKFGRCFLEKAPWLPLTPCKAAGVFLPSENLLRASISTFAIVRMWSSRRSTLHFSSSGEIPVAERLQLAEGQENSPTVPKAASESACTMSVIRCPLKRSCQAARATQMARSSNSAIQAGSPAVAPSRARSSSSHIRSANHAWGLPLGQARMAPRFVVEALLVMVREGGASPSAR